MKRWWYRGRRQAAGGRWQAAGRGWHGAGGWLQLAVTRRLRPTCSTRRWSPQLLARRANTSACTLAVSARRFAPAASTICVQQLAAFRSTATLPSSWWSHHCRGGSGETGKPACTPIASTRAPSRRSSVAISVSTSVDGAAAGTDESSSSRSACSACRSGAIERTGASAAAFGGDGCSNATHSPCSRESGCRLDT